MRNRTREALFVADIGLILSQKQPLQTTLARCVEAMVERFDAAFARIWTFNQATQTLELQASAGLYTHLDGPHSRIRLGEYKIGRIAKERRPHLTNDVLNDPLVHDKEWAKGEGMVAFAGYPLLLGDTLVGVVAMFSRQSIPESTLQTLEAIARPIALAIEQAPVEQALKEQTEIVRIVNRVGQTLAAELDLQTLVQAVTDAATTLTGAQFGAFFYNLIDERGELYSLYTLSGVPREAFSKFPMPRNTHIFGPTFRGEGIVRSDDITKEPEYGQSSPYFGMPPGHLPVRSYLAVPVISRMGNVLGGLFFGHSETGVFTEREAQLISGLAAQAAIAMDNAKLYTEVTSQRERLRVTLASIGDGVIVTDAESRVTFLNSVAEALTGWMDGEARGKPLEDVFRIVREGTYERAENPVSRVLRDGYVVGLANHTVLLRRDGREIAIDDSAAPIMDDPDQLSGVVLVFRDITERRRAEQEREALLRLEQMARVEAEKANALKLTFLGMVSHELRTPLASIKGFLSTLLASDVQWEPAQQREFLTIADQETDKLTELVSQLLDVSRLQAGTLTIQPEHQSLAQVVDVARAQLITLAAQHALVLDLPEDLPAVCADAQRIAQVLVNLVQNAARYSPDGTMIHVQARSIGNYVQVDVSDEGIGIPDALRESVFEAFRQINRGSGQAGAGLGLAICKGVVEAHGGSIWVQDRPGPGTTIAVTLPTSCAG